MRHSQSTGDVRATRRMQRKLDAAAGYLPRPTAPTPLLLHLGITARTHDVGQFRQNFPDQFDQFFVDRLVELLLFTAWIIGATNHPIGLLGCVLSNCGKHGNQVYLVPFIFCVCHFLGLTLSKRLTFRDLHTTVLWPFVWDYPGEPVPEETFTHSHLS